MKTYQTCIMVIASIYLSGCITKFDTKTMLIPDQLLQDCNFPKPPDPKKYANMDWVNKEKALVNTYLQAAEFNHTCNTRLQAARNFQQKLRNIYGDTSAKDQKVTNANHTPSSKNNTGLSKGQ